MSSLLGPLQSLRSQCPAGNRLVHKSPQVRASCPIMGRSQDTGLSVRVNFNDWCSPSFSVSNDFAQCSPCSPLFYIPDPQPQLPSQKDGQVWETFSTFNSAEWGRIRRAISMWTSLMNWWPITLSKAKHGKLWFASKTKSKAMLSDLPSKLKGSDPETGMQYTPAAHALRTLESRSTSRLRPFKNAQELLF